MRRILNIQIKETAETKMVMNTEQTKVINERITEECQNNKIFCKGHELDKVTCEYLGIMFTNDGKIERNTKLHVIKS